MAPTRFTLLLLTAICLLQPAHAQSGATSDLQVQVDLVFPKNDTAYKPTNPFPIVFAVHNFATAWSDKPTLQWRLTRTDMGRRTIAEEGWIGWREGSAPPPEAHFLYINSSKIVGRYNASRWTIEYLFSVGSDTCRGSLVDLDYVNMPGSRGSILFSTDIDRGVMPDVAATGTCATPLGSVSIIGKNQTDPSCSPLMKPNPAPNACAFAVNQKVADQVSKEMTTASGCKNGSWPLGTGIGQDCPNDKSTLAKSSGIASYPAQ
jgi:hypothetical protein